MKQSKSSLLNKTASIRLITAAGVALLVTCATIRADDDTPAPPPAPKKWDSVITLGATLTRGNSHTFLGTLNFNTKRKWTDDELLFGGTAGYGENTASTPSGKVDNITDSYIKGFGQFNHLFTTNFYGGLRIAGDHDDVAHLTYRVTVSPLAGYYFIKQTNQFLAGEIGPSYIKEKFFGETEHNYIGLRIGERGEHKFASGAKLWESVEWLPKVQDFQNYLVNAELGISAPVSKSLSLSLILQDTYKSEPAPGRQKNDVKLIAGLSYNF
jgi:putative salt-induced outer membrane protein YdiY